MASSSTTRIPPITALGRWITAHDQQIIRGAIIVLVFAAAAVLGRRPSLLPLLGIAGIVGVLLFYRWPELGLLLTIIAGMSIDWNGPSGLNIVMLGIALLVGLWLADMLVLRRRFKLNDWATVRAGLTLCLTGILSLLFGLLPWFPTQPAPLGAQLGGLALIFLAIGAFVWAGNRIRSLQWLKVITFGFIAFASLHLLGYFSPFFGWLINDRIFVSGSTGSMFWTWLAILAFSQALYNRQLGIVPRLALGLVTIATGYVAFVVQNDWKSGWVPIAVGTGVVLALSSWRVAIAVCVVGLAPMGALLQRLIASDIYSYSTRLEAWGILGEIVRVNPILGLGSANYYWYTPLFPIRGYFVSFNSHSQYIDIVAQFGLLGLLAFGWFLWEIGRVVWRMLRANVADDFARAYVIGAAGGFVAVIVAGFLGDWLFPFFYNVGMYGFRAAVLPWVFLGALVAIEAMRLPSRKEVQVNSAGPETALVWADSAGGKTSHAGDGRVIA